MHETVQARLGGAGVNLALKLLNGETVETATDAAQPNTVLLDPVLADNVSDDGRSTLESWQVDGLDPLWPLGLTIEGWTTYTPDQAVAWVRDHYHRRAIETPWQRRWLRNVR